MCAALYHSPPRQCAAAEAPGPSGGPPRSTVGRDLGPIDLSTVEGRLVVGVMAEVAEMATRVASEKGKASLAGKAKRGAPTGGAVFGYLAKNEPLDPNNPKGDKRRVVNPAEAAIIIEIFERYAAGVGPDTIARDLNARKVAAPIRAGKGFSAKAIRYILRNPKYRGIERHGVTETASGSALKVARAEARRAAGLAVRPVEEEAESGQIRRKGGPVVEREVEGLRIVPEDLAARVDARLLEQTARYKASFGTGRREGPVVVGTALLSGGMLICSTCGGNYELRTGVQRHKKTNEVVRVTRAYSCATRRRKPGACSSEPIYIDVEAMDHVFLDRVEEEALSPEAVEELMKAAPKSVSDSRAALVDRISTLKAEKGRLAKALATTDDEDVKSEFDARVAAIAKAEAALANLPDAPLDPAGLRAALEQRRHDWREKLRGSVEVARVLIRKLVSPMTIAPDPEPVPAFMQKEAALADLMRDLTKDLGRKVRFSGELLPALADGLMTCYNPRLRGPA
jgi:site-specific DNA recombinase